MVVRNGGIERVISMLSHGGILVGPVSVDILAPKVAYVQGSTRCAKQVTKFFLMYPQKSRQQ